MKSRFLQLFSFFNLSFLITYLIFIFYFLQINIDKTNLLSIFYLLTIPLYYYFFLFIIFLALSITAINRYLSYAYLFFKTIFDFYLLVNLLVFKTYNFHIDLLFIEMFFNDTEGMGVSWYAFATLITIFVLLFVANLYLFRVAKNRSFKSNIFLSVTLIILLAINQIIHIWGSYYNQSYITKYTPYFPLFYPTVSTRRVAKLEKQYPFLKPKNYKKKASNAIATKGVFHYPKHKIDINGSIKKPNILFITLESWEAKEMNVATTPHIYNFAKENINFLNHYSSGNVTTKGLFGLLYGLYATQNYKAVLSDPIKYQTVFIKTLKSLGYDIGLYTTSDFSRFSLKDMFFGRENKNIYILKSGNVYKNDKNITNIVSNSINNGKKPWFKFVFLTSSHFNYHYPKSFEKFKPIAQNTSTYLINKSVDPKPYINKYKNSLLYSDYLVNKILNRLKDKSLMDNTIVVITADHAEEFAQTMHWGHGSCYNQYQLNVPLIIHMPNGNKNTIKRRTYHIDIVPTILSYMGIKNSISDYSNGVDIFKDNISRDMIFSNYITKAYLVNDTIVTSGMMVKKYNIYNAKKEKKVDYKRLNKLKKAEVSFFN